MAYGKQFDIRRTSNYHLDPARDILRLSSPDSDALISSEDESERPEHLLRITSEPQANILRRVSCATSSPGYGLQSSDIHSSKSVRLTRSQATAVTDLTPNADSRRDFQEFTDNSVLPASKRVLWDRNIWSETPIRKPSISSEEGYIDPHAFRQSPDAMWKIDLPNRQSTKPTNSLPIPVPFHPTPKTYRSQSYSVGQSETFSTTNYEPCSSALEYKGTTRPQPQRRQSHFVTSQPGSVTLCDTNPRTEGRYLTRVKEIEDTNSSCPKSAAVGDMHVPALPRLPEIVNENHTQLRLTDDLVSHSTINRLNSRRNSDILSMRPSLRPRAYDHEQEDSRFGVSSETQGFLHPGMLHTGFNHTQSKHQIQTLLRQIPQSRRHSLAQMPSRTVSPVHHAGLQSQGNTQVYARDGVDMQIESSSGRRSPIYIKHGKQNRGNRDELYYGTSDVMPSCQKTSMIETSHIYDDQKLHMVPLREGVPTCSKIYRVVTFKCFRAAVYILPIDDHKQKISKGDLVLVDADRGIDLGTLASESLSLSEARRLVSLYNDKHRQWLMAFAQQNFHVTAQDSQENQIGSISDAFGRQSSADSRQDNQPRMIRRNVQIWEPTALREKEGAEAKAKRLCQQKVLERRLNMEILDAEFQIDWKKLTFYYAARSYVNFNPLVTDLFKLYKTRIWMSAINTAALEQGRSG